MKKTKRLTACLLSAAMLCAVLLSGCSAVTRRSAAMPFANEETPAPGIPYGGEQNNGSGNDYDEWLRQWLGEDNTRTAEQQTYGSAALLAWPTALVSVYLNEKDGAQWDEAMLAKSRANLAVAVNWMQAQAAEYGVSTKINYDDGTPDNGLCYTETYDGRFIGGEDGEETDAFYDAVDALCAAIDTDALHEKYGTSSIGFLVFLPVEGSSFTMVHYKEDGNNYYHEYSCLYAYDAYSDPGTFESPTVYAHEILHQYGAPDLYEGSSDYYVTPELQQYVADTWPDAIMYDTYEADGSIRYDAINKCICPLVAYRLGLCSTFEGADAFPAVTETPPGVFMEEKEATPEQGNAWSDLSDGAVAA